MQEVFEFHAYRKFLQHLVQAQEKRGILSHWAAAMQCQLSYLSRVVKAEVHLTPDQAFRLANFWQMTEEEKEYFLLLVDEERAGDPQLIKHLAAKRQKILTRRETIAERVNNRQPLATLDDITYHSSWEWTAIHFATSVPALQTVDALSKKFSLAPDRVREILETLSKQNYVRKDEKKWIYQSGAGHLPKSSPLLQFEHFHWRMKALADAQKNQSAHFTSLHTMSKKDFAHLRQLLTNYIETYTQVASPSEPEEVVVFCADLFYV